MKNDETPPKYVTYVVNMLQEIKNNINKMNFKY